MVIATICMVTMTNIIGYSQTLSYPVAGTNQSKFYNDSLEIMAPAPGQPFFGQDALYPGTAPSYTDNGNGTITDNVTGLMWQKTADQNGDGLINMSDEFTYGEALAGADTFRLAGYSDWRLPSIKESYSLILYSGIDCGLAGTAAGQTPFIDTHYFAFGYGDLGAGDRLIDAQYASSTLYVSSVMNGIQAMFGVNFADGRIKGYALTFPQGGEKHFYVKYVRGNSDYGKNNFQNNGDGTITDRATGLMWMQNDNGQAISWKNALNFAENFSFAGHSDWRLPDAKELQSIVDYTRSLAATSSAAIDPLFNCTQITDEGNNLNYPFYWASTTHANGNPPPGNQAVYICFGTALGWMEFPPNSGNYYLLDVHGAGSQRCDFKTGDAANYPHGFGPQGDVVRINNYVRLVRNTTSTGINENKDNHLFNVYPNPVSDELTIEMIGDKGNVSFELLNSIGHIVQTGSFIEKIVVQTNNLATGVYLLKLQNGNAFEVKKLIKE